MQANSENTAYASTILMETDASVHGSVRDNSRSNWEEKFNRIISEFGPALSRLAYGYEKVASVREELTQEIALAIWQALPYFRGACSERTFVYRIAHNRGLTHAYRRRPEHDPLDELLLEPVDPAQRPEERVAVADQHHRLRDAIQQLPLAYRQVVMLMLEDLSHKEIGEVLGISESNVAVRMNRARKALKEAMEVRS